MATSDLSTPSTSLAPVRVLVDTNVVLDQLLRRTPWFEEAQTFWAARDAEQIIAYLPASTLTDIFYIGRRQIGTDGARSAVARCLREFGILAVYRAILESANALAGADFEDNVQIACAEIAHLDCIVTRNVADFHSSSVPALRPPDILRQFPPLPAAP